MYNTKPEHSNYEVIIVGGGIVGLAVARELLLRQPDLKLLVLEKEKELATHQTGHNSGVIHAGIYYTPGSLKAKACVAGHAEMLRFAEENGVPFEKCGKVIVALNEQELPKLQEIFERGQKNGVADLELIDGNRLREIEPYAAGIKAVWSPNTGIINYGAVAKTYARQIKERDGEIVVDSAVIGIENKSAGSLVKVRSGDKSREYEVEGSTVITCSGLYSDKVSALTGESSTRIVPFRGDYYVLKPEKRFMVKGMIYPVPDPRFPFLGVHFTKRINGEVWAGPNAVLAFAREGYRRWDIKPKELWEAVSYRGFRKLALKYWKTGLAEMYRDYSKAAYTKELQKYMPEIKKEDLITGPSGVRAQALDVQGQLVDDFLIQQQGQVMHVLNAPSPAATSSLVIARMIVDKLPVKAGQS
jgi:L-2-hydroxyglutarate oxidase LhgO